MSDIQIIIVFFVAWAGWAALFYWLGSLKRERARFDAMVREHDAKHAAVCRELTRFLPKAD